MLTIDGTIGRVLLGAIPTVPPVIFPEFDEYLRWADEVARMKVRTNADTPADAAKAIEFGAKGIGLCRTEHMFLHPDRLPAVREMLLAAADAKNLEAEAAALRKEIGNATNEKRQRLEERLTDVLGRMEGPMGHYLGALEKILPMQQGDFEEIFRVMAGKPVTIRLIDPPMHEFLPDHDALLEEVTRLRIVAKDASELAELAAAEKMLANVNAIREQNPMLGLRGCRLGILYPEINAMQVQAIFRAAVKLADEGVEVFPEIMIPLVGFETELTFLRNAARDDGAQGDGVVRQAGGVPVRHDDRAAARRAHRGRDRQDGGVLLVRHERPDADDARLQPRRRRRASSWRSTWRWASSSATRSNRSTRSASAR